MASDLGHVEQDQTVPVTSGARLHAMLPSRRVLLIGLLAGLFVAWWGSFHEVACGCIKLHSVMSLDYLKLGCYTFSLGSAAAGLVVWLTGRRARGRGGAADAGVYGGASRGAGTAVAQASPKTPLTVRGLDLSIVPWLICAALGFLVAGFYISLSAEAMTLAIAFQLLLHIACATTAILAVMLLSDLPLSDVAVAAFIVLVCYMLFNNVLLPLTVGAIGSFNLVIAIQAITLVAMAALAMALLRDSETRRLVGKGWEVANAGRVGEARGSAAQTDVQHPDDARTATDASPVRIAPQPFLNLIGYYFVFGLMHVEASMRFGDYGYRNIPYVVGIAVAIALFYMTFMRKGSTMRIWPKVQSAVFTLTIAAFMLLPVISSTSSIIPVALIEAGYFYYDALFLLACLVIARESGHSLRSVLGTGFAVKGLSYFAGTIACHAQLAYFGESVLERPVAILVVFLLLASVTLWMGDTIVAKKLWGMRIERAPRHGADLALIQERCDRLAKAYHLTPRESEVCAQLAAGTEIEDAAEALHISVQTLRTHVRNVYAKTGVHARRELVKLAESMDAE